METSQANKDIILSVEKKDYFIFKFFKENFMKTTQSKDLVQSIKQKQMFFWNSLTNGYWKLDLRGSPQTVENSERDGNTKPPDLHLEKAVSKSGHNSYNWT